MIHETTNASQPGGSKLDLELKQLKVNQLMVIISAVAIVATIALNLWATNSSSEQSDATTRAANEQFGATSRETYFNNLLTGLASGSAAVQVTSMRLMTAFVEDVSNYSGSVTQRNDGVRNDPQTLWAFISDASDAKTAGPMDYTLPLPIIILRAIGEARSMIDDGGLGVHDLNLDRANLHGLYLEGLKPTGKLPAVGADLRRADLSGTDLRNRSAALNGAFLTCANLEDVYFGVATVYGTDFVGANLIGADLRTFRA